MDSAESRVLVDCPSGFSRRRSTEVLKFSECYYVAWHEGEGEGVKLGHRRMMDCSPTESIKLRWIWRNVAEDGNKVYDAQNTIEDAMGRPGKDELARRPPFTYSVSSFLVTSLVTFGHVWLLLVTLVTLVAMRPSLSHTCACTIRAKPVVAAGQRRNWSVTVSRGVLDFGLVGALERFNSVQRRGWID